MIKDKEFGFRLLEFLSKLPRPVDFTQIENTIQKLKQEEEFLKAKQTREFVDVLFVLLSFCQDDELKSTVVKLFSSSTDGIPLLTVHRAKGLEAKRVWIIDPENFPHPLCQSAWELAQEDNLLYVAITRAKEELYYVEDAEKSL